MSQSDQQYIFNGAFDSAEEISFNPEWANGTGYFDGAVRGPDAPKLQIGEIRRFADNKGRKALIISIGENLGNVVLFQRYSDDSDIYVANIPKAIKGLLCGCTSRLGPNEIGMLLGWKLDGSYNIGYRLSSFIHTNGILVGRVKEPEQELEAA
jgi:hypothetical protein